MLRLDQMQIHDQQQSAEGPGPAAAADHQQATPESQKAASKGQKAKLLPFSSQLKADDWLLETDWGDIDGAGAQKGPAALLLDLNDAQLSFEVLRGTEVKDFANAAATILPALPKVMLSGFAMLDYQSLCQIKNSFCLHCPKYCSLLVQCLMQMLLPSLCLLCPHCA